MKKDCLCSLVGGLAVSARQKKNTLHFPEPVNDSEDDCLIFRGKQMSDGV